MSIRAERDGAVLRLVLDKPERGNALSPSMMLDLASALRGASPDPCAAVIRGEGDRVFCSGYDLQALQQTDLHSADGAEGLAGRFPELRDLLIAMEEFPAPLVAELNGHAIGGGALLASFCDFRLARRGARLQIPATRLGVLYPLEGIRRLAGLIGVARAGRVLLTSASISDDEGLAWGLYDTVVDSDELSSSVNKLLEELGAAAPLSVQGLRAVLRGLARGADEASLSALHSEWAKRCLESRDLVEGLSAAVEGRVPRFEGC